MLTRVRGAMAVFLVVPIGGCATVPPDVVRLSDRIGQDVETVHAAYRQVVRTYFAGLRSEVNAFVDSRWRPKFLASYAEKTQLAELVRESPDDLPEVLSIWADEAIRRIELKRAQLLEPVQDGELEVLDAIDRAFAQILRGNATITGHLSSLRKVQDVQDRSLEAMGVESLRDMVESGLARASDLAAQGILELAKAENIVLDAGELKGQLGAFLEEPNTEPNGE